MPQEHHIIHLRTLHLRQPQARTRQRFNLTRVGQMAYVNHVKVLHQRLEGYPGHVVASELYNRFLDGLRLQYTGPRV